MGFVHDQDQVFQSSQVIEIALADVFREAFDPGRSSTPDFGIDLGDIEDIYLASQQPGNRLPVLRSRNYPR